ncbi:hypothetical protein NB706_003624 [Xanthomonas sacchari]|nr:hypothetical protein [Xanthomonas sacchari]
MGDAHVGRQRRLVHRETVVLRGDHHPAAVQILHRMVGAVVAVAHLQGLRAGGQRQQLVAQADAEGRDLARQQFLDRGDRIVARRRVAGAVGQEHAVRVHRQHLGDRRLRRHHGHLAAALGEHAQDVVLDPVVVGDDLELGLGRDEGVAVQVELAVAPGIGLVGGDHLGQIHALQPRELARRFQRGVHVHLAGHQRAVLRALLAQDAGQLAGVDAGDGDHAALDQPVRQRHLVAPVAGAARHVAHDQAGRPDLGGLVVLVGAAGVADMRIRQRDQLAGVGGIGEDLLVAGHGGVEHHFADGQAGSAYGFALEHGAVFKDKDCGLSHGVRLGERGTLPHQLAGCKKPRTRRFSGSVAMGNRRARIVPARGGPRQPFM